DLAGDELQAAARRFVVEENARAGEQAVTFAIVQGDVVAVDLGDAVGAARVKRGGLALGRLEDLAEHLAGAGLVETGAGTDLAEGVEEPGDGEGGVFGGEDGLVPGGGDEGLSGEVVDLVGLDLAEDAGHGGLVEQIGLVKLDAIAEVLDALEGV